MRDVNSEAPFLESIEENPEWDEPAGPPRKDLVYHGDVRRLLEIRHELLELKEALADFDEPKPLLEDPFKP